MNEIGTIIVSSPPEKKTTFDKPFRLWVKCNYCDYSICTERLHVIQLLAEEKFCKNCKRDMDLVSILYCSLEKGNILCELCEYRYKCFSEKT